FTALSHFEDAIAEVVVLSLFVPLCISTGGNSGSQAATLITRSMALGQLTGRDWTKVLRHELVMGLVLGLTLGAIGFVRAALTPESVRSSSSPRPDPFQVSVPKEQSLQENVEEKWVFIPPGWEVERSVVLPPGVAQVISSDREVRITLPEE